MTTFRFRALSGVGDIVTGDVEAGSRQDAVQLLRQRSLDPLSLSAGAGSGLLGLLNRDIELGRGRSLRLRREFAHDLAVLREAGAPLDRALSIMGEGSDRGAQLAQRIAQRSNAGQTLSAAVRLDGQIFDDASAELLAAGEATGDMAEALHTLAELTEDTIRTRSELFRSLTYPAVLILAALLAVGLMIFHVLPSFENLFAGAEDRIPRIAALVFEAGRVARAVALPSAVAVAGFIMLTIALWFTDWGRRRVDLGALRLPVLGKMLAGLDLGRAMLVMGRLLTAGATADRAVELAGRTCANSIFRADLRDAAVQIREGAAIAPSLGAVRFMPTRAVRMIGIGETSGALPRMLAEVARMLQDSARAGIKALLAVLPPVLTVIIGVLVAGLIYAVLTALLSVNELAL